MGNGTRVRLAERFYVVNNRRRRPVRVGTVVGQCVVPDCVRVRWDGNAKSSVERYAITFLELT